MFCTVELAVLCVLASATLVRGEHWCLEELAGDETVLILSAER